MIGIPDQRLGDIVVAWIRLKVGQTATEQEIRTFCRDRLAYYKVPEHIRFVDSYPMTLSGKVQEFKCASLRSPLEALKPSRTGKPPEC